MKVHDYVVPKVLGVPAFLRDGNAPHPKLSIRRVRAESNKVVRIALIIAAVPQLRRQRLRRQNGPRRQGPCRSNFGSRHFQERVSRYAVERGRTAANEPHRHQTAEAPGGPTLRSQGEIGVRGGLNHEVLYRFKARRTAQA